jgi:hypothetical protein
MTLGFIILRHVISQETNKYWIESYSCIRALYPDSMIIIIDDNSNYRFITEIPLVNTHIIESEFKGAGELLPYIYFLKYRYFDTAVIIHDSVFIKKYIDFTDHANKFLWSFEHDWDEDINEMQLLKYLDNSTELEEYYKNKSAWKGCFGGMSVISHSLLEIINNKYNINALIPYIKNRTDRMAFERVISVLISITANFSNNISIYGDIHNYIQWKFSYSDYMISRLDKPIYKIWTGR